MFLSTLSQFFHNQDRRFWIAVGVKLLVGALCASYVMRDWFVPFVDYFVDSGFANPWDHFYAVLREPKAFPYGSAMLLLLTVGKIGVLPLEWLFGPSLVIDLLGFSIVLLVADLAVYLVLCRLFPDEQRKVFYLYFCSPIIFYATYYHGQVDLIPVAVLLVALWQLFRQRYALSAILLGVGINAKFSIVVAVPFLIIFLARRIGVARTAAYAGLMLLVHGGLLAPVFWSEGYGQMVVRASEQWWLFDLMLHYERQGLSLMIAPVLMALLFFHYGSFGRISKETLLMYTGLAFMILVTLIAPMPGWYVWSYPFIVYCFLAYHDFPRFPLAILNGAYLAYFIFYSHSTVLDSLGVLIPAWQHRPMPPFVAASAASRWDDVLFVPLVASMLCLMGMMFWLGIRSNQLLRFRRRPYVIGIGGDSGSGKHTVAQLLTQVFGPQKSVLVHGDADHKWERGAPQWSSYTHLHPKANHLFRQFVHTARLQRGRSVLRADYDHDTGRFTTPRAITPHDVVLFVGLHPFYMPQMREACDLKIFLAPEESLRREWKLRRDLSDRQHDPQTVVEQLRRRGPDSAQFIAPQAQHADVIVRYRQAPGAEGALEVEYELSTQWHLDPLVQYFEAQAGATPWIEHAFDASGEKQRIRVFSTVPAQACHQYVADYYESFEGYLGRRYQFADGLNGFTQLLALYVLGQRERMGLHVRH